MYRAVKLTDVKHPEGTSQLCVRRIQHASEHVQKALKKVEAGEYIEHTDTQSSEVSAERSEQHMIVSLYLMGHHRMFLEIIWCSFAGAV